MILDFSRKREIAYEGHLPGLAIVADDLTGACDAAVAFAGRDTTVRVCLDGLPAETNDAYAVTTESRDVAPDEAIAKLARLAELIPQGAEIFKKVDSMFRGNTFAEIAASMHCFPARLTVLAPAYPAHGRRVKGGLLHVKGPTECVLMDLVAGLRAVGSEPLVVTVGEDAEERLWTAPHGALLLCDAWEQNHLETLARAAARVSERILWIGSGGLAQALAGCRGAVAEFHREAWPSGRTIFIVGSDHATTRQQVLHLREVAGVPVSGHGEGARKNPSSFVLEVPRSTEVEAMRTALAEIDPADTACLFLTGGDTAMLACRALGIQSLRLLREFASGVPMGIAEGGAFDGVRVMMKSGGFGERDLLQRVLEAFHDKDIVTA